MRYLGQDLIEAVERGDAAKVSRLLDEGADANAKDVIHRGTPLQAASWAGRLDIMELLVRSGADIQLISGDVEQSALEVAAATGQARAVEWLLANGANLPRADALRSLLADLESWGERAIVEMIERASASGEGRPETGA